MIRLMLVAFLCSCFLLTSGQQRSIDHSVNLSYEGLKLEEVLKDISTKYQVYFSYSKEYLPLDYQVYFTVENMPLGKALAGMLEPCGVVFRAIDNQIVLRMDANRKNAPVLGEYEQKLKLPERMTPVDPIEVPDIKLLDYGVTISYQKHGTVALAPDYGYWGKKEYNDFQLTVFPGVGINAEGAGEQTNRLSVNILLGHHERLHGMEFGIGVNSIRQDVKGLQLAGMLNVVQGEMSGIQMSGLFNINKGKTRGVQLAMLFNVVDNEMTGFQSAGFGNIVNGSAQGMQLAGIFNFSSATVTRQLSMFFNRARKVEDFQISGLNKADTVIGFQLGLVNICDTITGASFGLLNLVKKGYNRVEIGAGDVYYLQGGLKLGSRQFYNIFQFGMRPDQFYWGLGYGIGTYITMSKRSGWNFEMILSHVNEQEIFTDEMNWLLQFRPTVDIRLRERTSLFFGPGFNTVFSRVEGADGLISGSDIAPYTLIDHTNKRTNIKCWIGGQVGVRF